MKYRLIHSETEIVTIVQDIGTTSTMHTVFTGSANECRAEASRLSLTDPNDSLEIFSPLNTPSEIANWRAKAVLQIAGLLPSVESILAGLTGDEGIVARAAWSGNASLVRDGATVQAIASQLNLSSEVIDSLFLQASAIKI
jgi:hypothetical protein